MILAAAGHNVRADALDFDAAKIPAWVLDVTRMAFITPGQVDKAAQARVQVVHGNAVWPYEALRHYWPFAIAPRRLPLVLRAAQLA